MLFKKLRFKLNINTKTIAVGVAKDEDHCYKAARRKVLI